MSSEVYPFQNQYEFYLTTVKRYKERTMINANFAISTFWKFYLGSDSDGSISNVTETDVRSFFDYAETTVSLENSTLNKFLVHLKGYFAWLNANNLIKRLPTLFINGRPINRKSTVMINWVDHIEDFLNDDRLSMTTRKILLAISLGNLPKYLIDLTNGDILLQLKLKANNKVIENNFLKQIMTSKKDTDYFFPTSWNGHEGEKLKTNVVLRTNLSNDSDLLPFKSNLTSLRQSYVYTKVSNLKLSDQQLLEILKCNLKTLIYYKNNAQQFNLIDYTSVRDKYIKK